MTTVDLLLLSVLQITIASYTYVKFSGKWFIPEKDDPTWVFVFMPIVGPLSILGVVFIVGSFASFFIGPYLIFHLFRRYILLDKETKF